MKAIILAAGAGKRLNEYTKGAPKCLLRIGEESLLEREIRLLQEAGIERHAIYVVGGYKHEMLKEFTENLIINPEYDKKDNAYSLGLALQSVYDDDVLILDSDLCFEKELIDEIVQYPYDNVLLSKKSDDSVESTGIVMTGDGYVETIGKQYHHTGFVYISIFKIGKDTILPFREALLNEHSVKTWYTLAITEICGKYKFKNLVTQEKWHEIDFVEDYKETLEMFNEVEA